MLYFDKVMPMSLHSAAYVCPCITNAITYMHRNMGFWSINYLDDFGSAEESHKVFRSFSSIRNLLHDIGAQEAEKKAVEPCTQMEFLGTFVDTLKMTLSITPHREIELINELDKWSKLKYARKKQLQSLVGKLNFITNCVQSGRIFLNRLIQEINEYLETGMKEVSTEIMKDMQWWIQFLPTYQGTSMLWLCDCMEYNMELSADSCLSGRGGMCGTEYFHIKFSPSLLEKTHHISQHEIFTVMIAIKLWSQCLEKKVIRIYIDNEATMWAINKGKSKDAFMLDCVCEIAWHTARTDTLLQVKFVYG